MKTCLTVDACAIVRQVARHNFAHRKFERGRPLTQRNHCVKSVPNAILLNSHIPPRGADRISFQIRDSGKTEPPPTMLSAVVYCNKTNRNAPSAAASIRAESIMTPAVVPSLARPVRICQATMLRTLTTRSTSTRRAHEGTSPTLVAYREVSDWRDHCARIAQASTSDKPASHASAARQPVGPTRSLAEHALN